MNGEKSKNHEQSIVNDLVFNCRLELFLRFPFSFFFHFLFQWSAAVSKANRWRALQFHSVYAWRRWSEESNRTKWEWRELACICGSISFSFHHCSARSDWSIFHYPLLLSENIWMHMLWSSEFSFFPFKRWFVLWTLKIIVST